MTYAYKVADVRNAARGHWGKVFSTLAPTLREAIARQGKHVRCPVHGGSNGFRMYRNFEENGASVCNSCGVFKDGFQTLMFVNDWSFSTAVNEVGRVLGMKRTSFEQVDAVIGVGKKFCGILSSVIYESSAGAARRLYTVRLKEENTGQIVRCVGNDLKRAIEAVGIKRGDRVCLELVRTIEAHSKDHAYKRHVWSALKLLSKEQEAREQKERNQVDQTKQRAIEYVWKNALPLTAVDSSGRLNPALMYLHRRGIKNQNWTRLHESLRYVPDLAYRHEDKTVSRHPALIGAVRDVNGCVITLHRTYLTETGFKANVEQSKKLMAMPEERSLDGAAIRLGQVKGVIGVAEGVETALSVTEATGIPCWATLCAHGMTVFEPPAGVRIVMIWADKDRTETGIKAAKVLMTRLAEKGLLGIIMAIDEPIPESAKGIDWNDILLGKGKDAFPAMMPTRSASALNDP